MSDSRKDNTKTSTLDVLHVTDTHLYVDTATEKNGVAPFNTLCQVLDRALAQKSPDLLLATGDIAQDPLPETYQSFLSTVSRRYPGPLLSVPGNHDLSRFFSSEMPIQAVVESGWRIQGLDTHVDGHVAGLVSESALDSLERDLKDSPQYVLVAGHHPPFEIGVDWLDSHRVANGDEVVNVLRSAEKCRGYVCGHVHQPHTRIIGGIPFFTTPSTCWQFSMTSPTFSLDERPPGWRWLTLNSDGSIQSEVHYLTAKPAECQDLA